MQCFMKCQPEEDLCMLFQLIPNPIELTLLQVQTLLCAGIQSDNWALTTVQRQVYDS